MLPDSGSCNIRAGYNDAIWYSSMPVVPGATSATGYALYSIRMTAPAANGNGNTLMQIIFQCTFSSADDDRGEVYVDDVSLISVGGCEAYPSTGLIIENGGLEIQATGDSTYAWFGTKGVTIKGRTNNPSDPQPFSGNNFMSVLVHVCQP